jgi:AcrR family transcriptional regulator
MAGGADKVDGRSSAVRGTARTRLLEAAEQLLAERGYHATSVDHVVRAAGLSKGAFYWNFDSKEELFLALLEERLDTRARALMTMVATAGAEETTSGRVGEVIAALVDEHRHVVLLMNEFWALAVRDERLRERWIERQNGLRRHLAATLEARHETTGVPLTVDAQKLATAVIAMADGLARDWVAEPETINPGLIGDMLELLYDGLALRAQRAADERAG